MTPAMTPAAVALLMAASGLGWGAMALGAAKLDKELTSGERLAFAATLGLGLLGWMAFFPFLARAATPAVLGALLVLGLPGLGRLARPAGPDGRDAATGWTWVLLALLALAMAGTLAHGLAPPTDADSLAYHFAIPRDMVRSGGLVFVPRAADGAVPLLQQTTYAVALMLGGEQAMTIWSALTAWLAPAMAYVLARRHLPRDWSLAVALLMATLPAQVYAGASGQVEGRMAAFVTLALVAAGRGRAESGPRWSLVAGLAAGFAMASKYPGALIAVLAGLAMLGGRGWPGRALAFALTAGVFGGQWYGWNWVNTGDPVFPMLYGLVPYHPGTAWDEGAQAVFRQWAAAIESPLPRTLGLFAAYPALITFAGPDSLDAGRTGLGLAPLLLAPFALAGAWRRRHRLGRSPFTLWALMALGFYGLWFWLGASQRVRHYLPLMPLVLVMLMVGAERWSRARPARIAVVSGLAATLAMQIAGDALFQRIFVARLVQGQGRDEFIRAAIPLGFAALWMNRELPAGAKVVVNTRQWIYLLDHPAWLVTPIQQVVVDVKAETTTPRRFLAQMRAMGASHAVLPEPAQGFRPDTSGNGFAALGAALVEAGCAGPVQVIEGPAAMASRTLGLGTGPGRVLVVPLAPLPCPLD